MAPDLNSLSRSPQGERPQPRRTASNSAQSGPSSRRTSQVMGPPTVPASASASHFGNTERVPMPHRVSSSHEQDGPLRHPRPLTAAELYAECEKEQEAVVCFVQNLADSMRMYTERYHRSTASHASLLPCVHNPRLWHRTPRIQAHRPPHPCFPLTSQTPTQHTR